MQRGGLVEDRQGLLGLSARVLAPDRPGNGVGQDQEQLVPPLLDLGPLLGRERPERKAGLEGVESLAGDLAGRLDVPELAGAEELGIAELGLAPELAEVPERAVDPLDLPPGVPAALQPLDQPDDLGADVGQAGAVGDLLAERPERLQTGVPVLLAERLPPFGQGVGAGEPDLLGLAAESLLDRPGSRPGDGQRDG